MDKSVAFLMERYGYGRIGVRKILRYVEAREVPSRPYKPLRFNPEFKKQFRYKITKINLVGLLSYRNGVYAGFFDDYDYWYTARIRRKIVTRPFMERIANGCGYSFGD